MNFVNHCLLCENKIIDLKNGIRCKLTQKKPDFQIKCQVINLDEIAKKTVLENNIEYYKAKSNWTKAIMESFFLLLIGLIILIAAYFIFYGVSTFGFVPIIVGSIGISLIAGSFSIIFFKFKNISDSKKEKQKIDNILNLYNLEYIWDKNDSSSNKEVSFYSKNRLID